MTKPVWLERNVHAVLNFATSVANYRRRLAKVIGYGLMGDDIVSRAARCVEARYSIDRAAVHVGIRGAAVYAANVVSTEVCMVERIEQIDTELHSDSFCQLEVLID